MKPALVVHIGKLLIDAFPI